MENYFIKELIIPILIIAGALILYKIINRIVKKAFKVKVYNIDPRKQKTLIGLINNIIKYFIFIIAIIMILDVYGIDTKTIVASLGVVGLIVGLALQDILKDLLSGMFIIFESQYSVGDNVTIRGFRGEVTSLGLKTTKIKAYTGEVKIVSNRNVDEVINHSLEHSLAIIDIAVTYESDLIKVDKVLNQLCERLSKELETVEGKVEVLGVNKLGDSGIEYRLIATTTPLEHFEVERIIKRRVKDEFDKNEIEIPYPQVVVHNAKGV